MINNLLMPACELTKKISNILVLYQILLIFAQKYIEMKIKEIQYISPDLFAPKDAWDKLSMAEKSEMMKVAVRNGITDLKTIREKYNEFAEGGDISDEEYIDTMEKVAEENYKKWGFNNPDEALVHALNDNTYNYRGYYNKYPQSSANADTHWTDEFKTVYHPTFSNQSIYSGKKSQYNPNGRTGGFWLGEDLFVPAPWQLFSDYASGGKIHIKPENRGKFTALKERTGHSATWFKEHGTLAQKKMATFALNARHWKHGDGGPLVEQNVSNKYGGGGILDWLKGLFSSEPEKKPKQYTYRGKPAEITRAVYPNKQELKIVPKRQRHNTSKTKTDSERLENQMRLRMVDDEAQKGASMQLFDIPYIPEKSILINGSTTSTNVLDSLAKYAGIHNREPQLSEHPRKKRSSYGSPRKINMNEMIGLSTQETHNGAMPYFNYKNGDAAYNRALGNANYFTAFGYIPAENLVRNFQYDDANVNRSTPPLLDAFRYYAQGDYNTGDSSHTKDVNAAGKAAWDNPAVKDWWELSGKYWYNNGTGPKKK